MWKKIFVKKYYEIIYNIYKIFTIIYKIFTYVH